jgi:hypothetical protein
MEENEVVVVGVSAGRLVAFWWRKKDAVGQ